MEDRRDLDPAPPARCPATAAAAAPNLDRADRALLATLLAATPKARRQALRLPVTPDTVPRWHRDIVRRRWAARSERGRIGRPATRRNIKALVPRLARENPGWGYRRIHGELAGPGVKIAAPAVWEILNQGRDGPSAAADCAHLAAVPALPGRGDPGVRFLHRTCWTAPRLTSWP